MRGCLEANMDEDGRQEAFFPFDIGRLPSFRPRQTSAAAAIVPQNIVKILDGVADEEARKRLSYA